MGCLCCKSSSDKNNAIDPRHASLARSAAGYEFHNFDVKMYHRMPNSTSTVMVSTDIGTYYPFLAQKYAMGCRLLTFYMIPGQERWKIFSLGQTKTYQAIFVCGQPSSSNRRYHLKIEKSTIQPQQVWNGILLTAGKDCQQIFQIIVDKAQHGGRLISLELTGQETPNPKHGIFRNYFFAPTMGVDMFFEFPADGREDEKYVYNVITIPVKVTSNVLTMANRKDSCDWWGILQHWLGQGWKLVQIFYDQSESSKRTGLMSESKKNAQWFFEKPAARLEDPTPLYEGYIVEHLIHVTGVFMGRNTVTGWEAIIMEWGNMGWELACIVETYETHQNLTTTTISCLLFFQRPSYNLSLPATKVLSENPSKVSIRGKQVYCTAAPSSHKVSKPTVSSSRITAPSSHTVPQIIVSSSFATGTTPSTVNAAPSALLKPPMPSSSKPFRLPVIRSEHSTLHLQRTHQETEPDYSKFKNKFNKWKGKVKKKRKQNPNPDPLT